MEYEIKEPFVELSEEIVENAACYVGEKSEINNFYTVLVAGQQYKEAGLTPIYILNQESMELYVSAKETIGQTLH